MHCSIWVILRHAYIKKPPQHYEGLGIHIGGQTQSTEGKARSSIANWRYIAVLGLFQRRLVHKNASVNSKAIKNSILVARPRIELGTQGFSVLCSTN